MKTYATSRLVSGQLVLFIDIVYYDSRFKVFASSHLAGRPGFDAD